jgi:hypothetical protein
MPTVFYKVHGGRVTFAEYWRLAPDPFSFLIAAGMKLFGGISFDFSIPRIDSLQIVEWDDVSRKAQKQLAETMELFEGAGFEFAFVHEVPVLERHRYGVSAVFLSADRLTFGMANYFEDKVTKQRAASCVTKFDEGYGYTTTEKKTFVPLPESFGVRHPGMPADELYERHQGYLEGWEREGKQPLRLSLTTLPEVVMLGEQRFVDFHIDRGIFIPMTKAEIRRIRAANAEEDED